MVTGHRKYATDYAFFIKARFTPWLRGAREIMWAQVRAKLGPLYFCKLSNEPGVVPMRYGQWCIIHSDEILDMEVSER